MHNKLRLFAQMLLKGLVGFTVLGSLLFGCAGTLHYANAWLLIVSLGTLMLGMGLLLFFRHPETLERRLRAKEQESAQKGYMALIGLLFLASFALAGLDYRFGWSRMPAAFSVVALLFMFSGYTLFGVVTLQNAYASRVVAVQKGQTVISTGVYAVVRHPMYTASLLLFLSMPFVLSSYIALLPMLLFPVMLVLRIKNEEAVLMSALPGYADYAKRTRYRLIPYIW